jgi:hypothetical protein
MSPSAVILRCVPIASSTVNTNPPRPTAKLPMLGFPGQNGIFTVVPIFAPGDPRNTGGPGGLPGEYEITFTLNRPGYPLQPEGSVVSSDQLRGDSHLRIPEIFQLDAKVEGEAFTFLGKRNEKSFLASLVVNCRAHNTTDAYNKGYRAVTPILSNFGLLWDVPLTIYQVDVKEVRTGTRQITQRNPFNEISLTGKWTLSLDPEIRAYGAIYREALISENINYQFLCLFRLIESMQARRKRLMREAKRYGRSYSMPAEIYPGTRAEAESFLDRVFPVKSGPWDVGALDAVLVSEALGKGFTVIIGEYLKPIRHSIAHTLLREAAELTTIDDHVSRARVEKWLAPAKCIMRSMHKSDFGLI